MEYGAIYLGLAVVFGMFMAWGVGANDVANAMGTSVGSRAISIKQALIIAAIFELAGTVLAGGEVTSTIRSGIIDPMQFQHTPELLVYGMLASLLAAGVWLVFASYLGWPVSTTHTIVGALVGFGSVCIGIDSINWSEILNIVASWVVTPFIGGVLSYFLFQSVQKLILNTKDPFASAKRYIPYYIFLTCLVISMVTLHQGVKHLGIHLSFMTSSLLSIGFSFLVGFISHLYIRNIQQEDTNQKHRFKFTDVEKIFGILMVFTACAMAFAHGSNDVANAIGPLAAVVSIVKNNGIVAHQSAIPNWILLLGGIGIILGLLMYGYRVILTIGSRITDLTPSRGFAATLSAASTVVVASGTGLPVSTTQTLVGAVLGVGIAKGIGALNLKVIRNILLSWVITLPAGAFLAIIFYYSLKLIFHH